MKRFLKKWLKRRLIKIAIETKKPISTHLFEWIYNSPIYTWRDKLLIARIANDLWEEYYCWLNRDNT